MTSTLFRMCSSQASICSDKVRDSPHFENEITLLRNYPRESEMRHSDGSTRWCVPTGTAESKIASISSRIIMTFASPHKWSWRELSEDLLCHCSKIYCASVIT
jgi:hypothetical protein